VEWSDMIVSTRGALMGAILIRKSGRLLDVWEVRANYVRMESWLFPS
jgi:hypothetical protein